MPTLLGRHSLAASSRPAREAVLSKYRTTLSILTLLPPLSGKETEARGGVGREWVLQSPPAHGSGGKAREGPPHVPAQPPRRHASAASVLAAHCMAPRRLPRSASAARQTVSFPSFHLDREIFSLKRKEREEREIISEAHDGHSKELQKLGRRQGPRRRAAPPAPSPCTGASEQR